jgi:hypothetical protein
VIKAFAREFRYQIRVHEWAHIGCLLILFRRARCTRVYVILCMPGFWIVPSEQLSITDVREETVASWYLVSVRSVRRRHLPMVVLSVCKAETPSDDLRISETRLIGAAFLL